MKKNLKLLREWYPLTVDTAVLKESIEKNGGKVFLKGVLQKAETLNQNGRIYPKTILEREVRNYQKLINENRALGECDHPDHAVVELKNVSHVVREAYLDGDVVFGTIEILDTPKGEIIKSLIKSGITLGISSRGVGTVQNVGGNTIVQEDFQLICFDMVSEPSTPGAFMLSEAVDLTKHDVDAIFDKTDRIDRIFNDILEW